MTTFEKFCLSLWLKIISAGVCAVLAGCGAVVAGPSGEYDAALIAIVDADMERPELPDSLDEAEPTGAIADDIGLNRVFITDDKKLPLVQVFTTAGCGPCDEAKVYFAKSKIPSYFMPKNPDFDKHGYPSLAWYVRDHWEYQFGWKDGPDFEKRYYGSLK